MLPQNLQNDNDIEALKPSNIDYKRSVGKSLFILVKKNGAKCWRFKFLFAGKAQTLSIGVFPQVSFSMATKARDEAKELLRQKINPSSVKREEKLKKKENNKIASFCIDILDDKGLIIKNGKTTIKLSQSQTEALKSFLNSTPNMYEGS